MFLRANKSVTIVDTKLDKETQAKWNEIKSS